MVVLLVQLIRQLELAELFILIGASERVPGQESSRASSILHWLGGARTRAALTLTSAVAARPRARAATSRSNTETEIRIAPACSGRAARGRVLVLVLVLVKLLRLFRLELLLLLLLLAGGMVLCRRLVGTIAAIEALKII